MSRSLVAALALRYLPIVLSRRQWLQGALSAGALSACGGKTRGPTGASSATASDAGPAPQPNA
ncbi:MAG: hypothetical protein KJO07_18160, partial [Deltaproteobacteria bacterium]|nr:hypothetical protein [Deltaproteobacteria bacterium]